MTDNPENIFTGRAADFAQVAQQYKQKAHATAWLRLAIFLAGAAGSIFLFNTGENLAGFILLIFAYALFLVALKRHTKLKYIHQHNEFLSKINQEEGERLKGNLNDFDNGNRYRNAQHAYTSDLDIFGNHSLFQVLNRAVTGIGKDKLANWLQQRADAIEIKNRQETVTELTPDISWRQELQAKALHYKHTVEEPFQFFAWLQAPDFFAGKAWLKILVFLLPILTTVSIVLWFLDFPGYPAILLMLIQYFLCFQFNAARDEYYDKSSGMYDVLRSYRDILKHIETRKATSKKFKHLASSLTVSGKPASEHIHSLTKIVEYLSARMNVYISLVINAVLMWDFFWMWRLEIWKKKVSGNMSQILEVVAETETLAGLAAFQFANPTYTIPEISQTPFEVSGKQIGHPLIFTSTRISNDFTISGAGQTCIITGSNMSGKSTFLRTVGLNLVLAQAGAPVSAAQFRFFPVQVFTAMRTEDNLSESTSSFYAELKRLKMMLDLSLTGEPVFYLLDEILKGTNSRDRHEGAKALIKQLHQRKASGLVSTHDLELGAMEKEHQEYIRNYSFNSTIEGDKILFDYQLIPGVCRSFNASKLMQLMGIEMEA